jgi:hypothetical protein
MLCNVLMLLTLLVPSAPSCEDSQVYVASAAAYVDFRNEVHSAAKRRGLEVPPVTVFGPFNRPPNLLRGDAIAYYLYNGDKVVGWAAGADTHFLRESNHLWRKAEANFVVCQKVLGYIDPKVVNNVPLQIYDNNVNACIIQSIGINLYAEFLWEVFGEDPDQKERFEQFTRQLEERYPPGPN